MLQGGHSYIGIIMLRVKSPMLRVKLRHYLNLLFCWM